MSIFTKAEILLPKEGVDMEKWAVIACDQHTSDAAYWKAVEDIVGDAPSALRFVLPEIYLNDAPARSEKILADIESDNALEKALNGLVLIERGGRRGLLAALDLEKYDYRPGSKAPVKATEQTISERLPARVTLRKRSPLEMPHVLLLMDDHGKNALFDIDVSDSRVVYDFDLMLGGGHIKGYALEDESADAALKLLHSGEFRFAVGDGNHSLAAAKHYWEAIKSGVSENHPARYALVEVTGLYDPALKVLPIHRFIYGANLTLLRDLPIGEGESLTVLYGDQEETIQLPAGQLAVKVLQEYLDSVGAIDGIGALDMDFIHEPKRVRALAEEGKGLGIILPDIDRSLIFRTVETSGVLPRKSFSLGEAQDKRYYIECRSIK